jgi:hypothetical protein
MKRYIENEMRGLKLTDRGEMVLNVLVAVGSAAVLIASIVAGWAFLMMLATN